MRFSSRIEMGMRSSSGLIVWFLAAGMCLADTPSPVPSENEVWVEVDQAHVDMAAITDRGRQILHLPHIDWKHAQTGHFVIHYEQAIFARKVARMAEFFYSFIAQDLQGAKDHVGGRSHIFIFRSEKRWKEFAKIANDVPAWTFSYVEGAAMFLHQAENTSSSGDVLAHEMTHMVMNRFFKKRCPLWLNEGLAEYYRVFAYSAYKGVKKSKRTQFTKLANPFPLEDMLDLALYPSETRRARSFYNTAQYFVAYLLLERQPETFLPFVDDLMSGMDVKPALSKHYGLATMEDIQKAFNKFAF